MELGLQGKRVLVTGASSGIGAATAKAFAAEGAHLVLVARSEERLCATADAIRASGCGGEVEVHRADLADSRQIDGLFSRHPGIDVLVNNAGAVPSGSLFEVDEQRWREGWDSKVFPYIHMCRRYYPALQERGGGVIVNVLGNGSRIKRAAYICGGMANAALDFFTETLGARSAEDNIRVVGISPGPVDTERYRAISAARAAQGAPAPQALPFGRIATAQEVADLIVIAASHKFGYVSGTILTVDAGISVGTQK